MNSRPVRCIFSRKANGIPSASVIALTAALAAALPSVPAMAQESTAPQEASEEADPGTVIVTGSRIKRNGFNEPTPATVMSGELMANLGQVNISETLKLIPQNSSFQSDATAGTTAGANVGASFANLRGLNPFNGTRTLTLVNSRRFIPTSDGGAIDLNIIPSAMIQRVETVTGGASAAYGSDAIAGVVNVILENNFQGIKAQVDYGQTTRNDGKSFHASLMGGTSFGDGRGHFVAGIEYQKNEGIGDCAKVRLWCAESYDIFVNSNSILPGTTARSGFNIPGSPTYGLPHYVIGPDSKQAYNEPRGVLRNRGPAPVQARNLRFNEDGTAVVQFDPGRFVGEAQIGPRQGGDGVSTYDDSDIQTPLRRWVGYVYGQYDLTDALQVQTEFTYARRTASSTNAVVPPRSTNFFNADNAFLPESVRTLLNGAQFSFGKDMDGLLQAYNESDATVFRGLLGLSGPLFGDWTWDAYYQYGRNDRHQQRTGTRVNTPFIYATDAVDEGLVKTGVANGNIVCRELTKANPDPRAQGCVALNLFGLNNADPRALAYAYRPVMQDFKYSQHVLSGSVQGTIFDGWGAGPISAAAGADYRVESGDVWHGDIPDYNDYAFTFGLDYAGEIKVLEGFGELNVPVFRDSAIGDLLELNGAIRYTRNHAKNRDSGEQKTSGTTSWKVSAVYDVIPDFRIRASRSRDIRAAGFRELFLRNVPTEPWSTSGIVNNWWLNPVASQTGNDGTPILNGGSFALTPEKADTTTLGAVFQPRFVPGLRFSVDWYQIKINDAVTTLPGQRIVDFCHQFDIFCDRITFAGADRKDITFIDARQVNLAKLEVRGIDVELDYRLNLSDIASSWNGALNFRILGNHQYDFISQANPAASPRDYGGQSGPVVDGGDFNPAPPWIWNAFVTYDNAGFNTTLTWRRISQGIYNVERIGPEDEGYDPTQPNSINTNRVKGATYFNLAMSYRLPMGQSDTRHIELFASMDNIFDRKPPVAPGGGGGGGSNYPTNPVYFDTFGSKWRAGIRVRY
ncbi:outer membrane receptor protein involved in Fe transport [Sphingobium sp. B1D3A]|uniref:Outer membrane receptor protein involved in Fe transport n=1 Tax=Sphingobium lignivorans TaxID=2735886 RepID=A0ABR6NHU5_9SPHN|nr:outer membrane receptor protein involved in Fe transport [Sphingobium lignivorans]